MRADGNLISKGQGEGEAIMLQPFTPDQSSFQQMNQVLAQQQAQKNRQAEEARQAENAKRESWLKDLSAGYKYHPKDEKGIYNLQKELVKKIENHKYSEPTTDIQQELIALKYLTNTSAQSLEQDNKLQLDRLQNADKVWYRGLEDYEKAIVDNEGTTYEDMVKGIARRDAARKLVVQGGERINNPYAYLDKMIAQAPMGEAEVVASKDKYGNTVNKIIQYTDPEKLKEVITVDFNNNPEAQRVFGSVDEMINQSKDRAKFKTNVNIKGQTQAAKTKSSSVGSGASEAGNFTFSPPVKYNLEDTKGKKSGYDKYVANMRAAADKETSETQKKLILKKIMSEDDFTKQNSYISTLDAVPFSIKGVAENSPHKFIVEGEKEQVDGVSNLYCPSKKAFIVQNKNGVFLAPVEKNTAYITDNGTVLGEFYNAVGQTKGGNVVTTGKDGNVISKEKQSAGNESNLIQVYPKTKEEWDKAPKGSFYITVSGKKITK
jgi:hypothetical protein